MSTVPMPWADDPSIGGEVVLARELTVSVVIGVIAEHDAISTSCLQKLAAIRCHCRQRSIRLRLKVYTYASDNDDSAIVVVQDPGQVVYDLHFLGSDLVLYEFGIYSPLFDTIFLTSRLSRVVVFYYGITPPHLYPGDNRDILYRSFNQLQNLFMSDLVVTTSGFTASELDRVGLPRHQVRKLGLCVDFGRDGGGPRPGCRDSGGVRLLYVGRFVSAKGVLDLVQAVERARHETESDLRLALAGSTRYSDRDYIGRIADFIKERGLSDAVRWRFDVSRPGLQDEYRAADAVVIPSYHEGFCVPVLEAYAHGCFVICSDAGALPETSGGLGRTFAVGNVADLASRIVEFLSAKAAGRFVTDLGSLSVDDWSRRVEAHVQAYGPARFQANFDQLLCDLRRPRSVGADLEMLARVRQEFLLRTREATLEPLPDPVERKLRRFLEALSVPAAEEDNRMETPEPLVEEDSRMETPIRVPRWIGLKRRFRSIPVLGKALVHLKRALLLPRTVHRIHLHLFELAEATEQRSELRAARLEASFQEQAGWLEARMLLQGGRLEARWQERSSKLEARLQEQGARLEARWQEQADRLERELRDHFDRLERGSEVLTEEIRNQYRWIEGLATQFQDHRDLILILARKLQMLALDVRERNAFEVDLAQVPEPRIVTPEGYSQRIAMMGDQVRINLGCGEKPLGSYINVDFREMSDVDIIADVRALPFEPGSVAEIMSAHLVEHFRQHQLKSQILPYWKDLLAEGGTLRIICPNWHAMMRRLADGRMSYEDFRQVTFGAQDYVGDDHFAMYTPESLSDLLRECGFEDIEVLATDRMNGQCPEMELTAKAGRRQPDQGQADGQCQVVTADAA